MHHAISPSGQDKSSLPAGFAPEWADRLLVSLAVPIHDLTANSREVKSGTAFLAYPGAARDGRDYIGEAIQRGASAVFWEAQNFQWRAEWPVPNCAIAGLKQQASAIAGAVFQHPSAEIDLIGITGTNGKTSVSQWVALALTQLQRPAAVIGTIGNGMIAAGLQATDNTTPDAITLQRNLRQYISAGAKACAMEVSSHGLEQGRAAGLHFDVAVFTNLTRDHLDYHGTMEAYAAAKEKLFFMPGLKAAVINIDDAFGSTLAGKLSASVREYQPDQADNINCIRYSANGHVDAELYATGLSMTVRGMRFAINGKFGHAEVQTSIIGAFNVANLLAVIGALLALGYALPMAAAVASQLKPVLGRMQVVVEPDEPEQAASWGQDKPLVVVDYAHTPDALEKALTTLRAVVGIGKLICVFGCGGNRDKGKRSQMGAIAARLADMAIVTSDNPRLEDPHSIIHDIVQGMVGATYLSMVDRQEAIFAALRIAQTHDVVLIAGKGHEDYQIIGAEKQHFSDVEVAQAALAAWPGGNA